jgi:hypothetical protein
MPDGLKWEVRDSKNRVLYGRRFNDEMVYMRYEDMKNEEKNLILDIFALASEIEEKDVDTSDEIKEMRLFLDFKDKKDDFCG